VSCPKISINSFENIEEREVTEKIFKEFNTLSVVYKKPAELFINVDEPKEEDEDENEDEDEEVDEEEEEYEEEEEEDAAAAEEDNAMGDMLFDNNQQQQEEDEQEQRMALNPNAQCASKLFQKIWKGTKDRVEKIEKRLKNENGCNDFEQLVNNAHFKTMAAAPNGRKRKFYFYAQEGDNDNLHFIEVNINLDTLKVKITVKGQSDFYQDVGQYFCYTLNSILAD